MSDLVSPTCPKCHGRRTSRVKRVGFYQTVVLPYFDHYPWECSGCRSVFTFKNRGTPQHVQRSTGEGEMLSSAAETRSPRQ